MAIVTSAAINMGMQLSLQDPDSNTFGYSCLLLSAGDWFQEPPQIPKCEVVQVSYVKWCNI